MALDYLQVLKRLVQSKQLTKGTNATIAAESSATTTASLRTIFARAHVQGESYRLGSRRLRAAGQAPILILRLPDMGIRGERARHSE